MSYLPVRLGDCHGGDTNAKIGLSQARALRDAGVVFLWRYVFFGPPRLGDIDPAELNAIRLAGLTLLLVQHVRSGSWEASQSLGTQDAVWATRNARAAGYAPVEGCPAPCLALDMESLRNPGPDAVAHAVAWCDVVSRDGFRPVVYEGFDCGLTASELAALGVPLWSDFGPRTPPPGRGFCCKQASEVVVAGVTIDPDHAYPDLTGEALVGMGEVAEVNVEGPGDPAAGQTTQPAA